MTDNERQVIEMKKITALILALITVFSLALSSSAAEGSEEKYSIKVNGVELDTSSLPLEPYYEGEHLMVPLRMIAEALGYKVTWNSETHEITVDDEYIQSASLFSGTAEVNFTGHLKVIDMTRTWENEEKTVIHDGYTYVPLEFFTLFFNDVSVNGSMIEVSPSVATLD